MLAYIFLNDNLTFLVRAWTELVSERTFRLPSEINEFHDSYLKMFSDSFRQLKIDNAKLKAEKERLEKKKRRNICKVCKHDEISKLLNCGHVLCEFCMLDIKPGTTPGAVQQVQDKFFKN